MHARAATPQPQPERQGTAETQSTAERQRTAEARVTADSALYPIGVLAQQAGVSTRTVRYYEEIGLLRTARRYAGGRRVFGSDALERLSFIARLKRLGFSLDEIRELNEVFALHESTTAMLRVLDLKLGQHEQVIDEQMTELVRLREDIAAYRQRIGRRLAATE